MVFYRMNFDLSELVGQSLTLVRNEGTSWAFIFSGADAIFTEEPWRVVTPQGILISSLDDRERFGLPAPIDAGEAVIEALQGEDVTGATYDPCTGDLEIEISGDRKLQFLQLSSGYESWRLHLRDTEFICLGGGALAEFPRARTV